MKFVAICALLGALLGSGVAYTQVLQSNSPQPVRSRYLAKFDAQFNAADKDSDGALTRAEAQAAGLTRIVDNFDRLDADKDGKVTREELRSLVRNRISS